MMALPPVPRASIVYRNLIEGPLHTFLRTRTNDDVFSSTAKFDYFENQGKLHQLHDVVTSDNYVIASSVNSWYEDYISWASKNKPVAYFDQSKELLFLTIEKCWYSKIKSVAFPSILKVSKEAQ